MSSATFDEFPLRYGFRENTEHWFLRPNDAFSFGLVYPRVNLVSDFHLQVSGRLEYLAVKFCLPEAHISKVIQFQNLPGLFVMVQYIKKLSIMCTVKVDET